MSAPWNTALSKPHTRRQSLRALLAGAALTVPLVRSAPVARAAGPNDCRKGCFFTNGQRVENALHACRDLNLGNLWLGAWLNPVAFVASPIAASYCLDQALLRGKARAFDCMSPGCPGFDPQAPGGPCDGCRDNCCTCQASPTGYICCVFACSDTEHNCCPS